MTPEPRASDPQPQIAIEPQITALPHLSAPIDEGPLFPKPGWRRRDKLLLIGAFMIFAALLLAFAFTHATITS